MGGQTREHAVVLGASISGLLTARVLAGHYARVTLVERDRLPVGVGHRRGVPHGRHLHGLHPRGADGLERLFPGLTAELRAAGAVTGDTLADVRVMVSGHRLTRQPSGRTGLFLSRPLLEAHVRDRVRRTPNITVLDGHDVVAPTGRDRSVTGVRVADGAGAERDLAADLVVDATGRGSRAPRWLVELGYPAPREERVDIDLHYASRRFRLRAGALAGAVFVAQPSNPQVPRLGVLAALEDGSHLLTLGGILGDRPPAELAGFLAWAGSLQFPDIADAVDGAEPLDDGEAFRFPASVWRHYERLAGFPPGLLVTGDAVCSFNPAYGQGMTVAVGQAEVLDGLLRSSRPLTARRWFAGIARVIANPWAIAVGGDLAYPGVAGRRTPLVRLINAYLPHLHAAATDDAHLARAFVSVVGLLEPPAALLRPDRLARVARGRLRRSSPAA